MRDIPKNVRERAEQLVEVFKEIDEKLAEEMYKAMRKNQVKKDIEFFFAKDGIRLTGLPEEQLPDVIDAAAEKIVYENDDVDPLADYTGVIINTLDEVTSADIDPWEVIFPMN